MRYISAPQRSQSILSTFDEPEPVVSGVEGSTFREVEGVSCESALRTGEIGREAGGVGGSGMRGIIAQSHECRLTSVLYLVERWQPNRPRPARATEDEDWESLADDRDLPAIMSM